ncbi:MAG: archaetidylserine decarboxylase [Myxococcota bacterium]|nr:archaetidylserine decarboxylase [Myxococcota bacterium]
MKRDYVVDVVERLPQALISRAWGWLARREHPRAGVAVLKRVFVAYTGIDMSEAADDIGSYSSLEELFVRTLKPGARRIEPEPTAFVSPVDGTVGACGTVESGTLFQVKGRSYELSKLLDDVPEAARYEGGAYCTIYLSPRDYHRIHAPISGVVSKATAIPGALMPVFTEAVEKVDELFARNERLISYVDSADAGRVAVVKVGATLVGRMTVPYDNTLRTNQRNQTRMERRYDPPHLIQKGGELGAFELGSTVVIIAEPGRLQLKDLREGQTVLMGEGIGTVTARRQKRTKKTSSQSDA